MKKLAEKQKQKLYCDKNRNYVPVFSVPHSASESINLYRLSRYYQARDNTIPTPRKIQKLKEKWKKVTFKKTEFVNCWMCQKQLDKAHVTIDHIIPISKGGDWKEFTNIAPACEKCNNSKGSNIRIVSSVEEPIA